MGVRIQHFGRHWWGPWLPVQIIECPDGELVTVMVRKRRCLFCGAQDEEEVVLSCV